MPKIFISYRREDTAPQAGRLFDRLAAAFGAENVFRDLDRIGKGLDFVRVMDERLAQCDCVLVVIGKNWLDCVDAQGKRRLEDPEDFVCREINGALNAGKFIIPILVDGAKMPKAAQLPSQISALANRNALEVLESHYEDDIARLIETVAAGGRQEAPLTLAQRLRELRLKLRVSRVGTAFALTVAFVVFFLGWMRLFDFLTLDTRVETYTMALGERWLGALRNDGLALIAIDEASERRIGRAFDRSWRREHTQIVDHLVEAGAKAIAFDLWFDDADPADAALAAAFARARARGISVIVGVREAQIVLRAPFGAHAAPALLCVGNRIGYASVAPLAVKRSQALLGGLALLAGFGGAAIADIDSEHTEVLLRNDAGIGHVKAAAVEKLRNAQPACGALRKDDVVASLIIPLSPLERLRREPMRTAYEQALSMDAAALTQRFGGKVVLIGVQKPNQDVLRVRGNEERYGMELHADVVQALQNGVFIRPAGPSLQFALILLMGVAGSFLALRIEKRRLALRVAIVSLAALLYVAFAVFVYAQAHLLLNYLYHLAAFGVSYLGMRYLFLRWAK
jgi:CHASE2 domain-containing sensor protein